MHDYGLGRASERPRRQVWYRSSEDPIEIPRGSSSSGSLAMVISAVIASSVILGGAYAIYVGPPATMARTEVQALTPTWQLDTQPQRANVEKVLRGQAPLVPNVAPSTTEQQEAAPAVPGSSVATPTAPAAPSNPPASTRSSEVVIDDRYQLPQPSAAPETQPQVYPDPVKTPAEAIGPELNLDKPTPALDPENPYRE
jgi:hypothetical protein